MGNKEEKSLSWDDFVKLGNPDNAPDMPEEIEDNSDAKKNMEVRLHYEKKGRRGKEAVIIRGIEEDDEVLKDICKKMKTKLGVGGSTKGGEIIMQGAKRDQMLQILLDLGYRSAKKSGG